MSIADLMPIRLGWRERPARKHRAPDEIQRLQAKLAGAELLIKGLHVQLDDKDRAHAVTADRQGEAELLVVQLQADVRDLTGERDEWKAEALELRARFGPQLAAEANANRITVPPMVRPIDGPEEQATAPIDVRPLWAARDAGLLGAVTDPGHVPAT